MVGKTNRGLVKHIANAKNGTIDLRDSCIVDVKVVRKTPKPKHQEILENIDGIQIVGKNLGTIKYIHPNSRNIAFVDYMHTDEGIIVENKDTSTFELVGYGTKFPKRLRRTIETMYPIWKEKAEYSTEFI